MSDLGNLLAQAIFAPPGTQNSVAQGPNSPVLWNLMQLLKQPQSNQHPPSPSIPPKSAPPKSAPPKSAPKKGGKP